MEEQQQPSAQPQEDLSSKTILLLVILTLAVSFIGAWVNINTAMTASAPQDTPQAGSAEVSFYIEPPTTRVADSAGMVSLTLEQPQ